MKLTISLICLTFLLGGCAQISPFKNCDYVAYERIKGKFRLGADECLFDRDKPNIFDL